MAGVVEKIWLIQVMYFVDIYNTEFVMTGVVRQRLKYNVYPLT